MFFTDPVQDGTSVELPSVLTRITIIFSILVTIVLGVYPAPLLNFITQLATFIR